MTPHHLEQLIGWWLIGTCGPASLVAIFYSLGGHRVPTGPRLPRCVVRANDYLTSVADCTDEPQQVTR